MNDVPFRELVTAPKHCLNCGRDFFGYSWVGVKGQATTIPVRFCDACIGTVQTAEAQAWQRLPENRPMPLTRIQLGGETRNPDADDPEIL